MAAALRLAILLPPLLLLQLALLTTPEASAEPTIFDLGVQKAPRVNIPFLGLGIRCNGCPPRSCEDDPAVVYGYCCGCSRLLDRLPVLCPKGLNCPLNGAGLCHDYEYMMRCCC